MSNQSMNTAVMFLDLNVKSFMLIALPKASLPHVVLITYFTQSTNMANHPHISATCEEPSNASDGQGNHDND